MYIGKLFFTLGAILALSFSGFGQKGKGVPQVVVPRIEQMPALPTPYFMKDWRQTALGFDAYVYNFEEKGPFMPLIWLDPNTRNSGSSTFGHYTVIGDVRQGPLKNNGEAHEALAVLGSLLGGTLVGIDKSKQHGMNFVRMAQNYFNTDNGWNIVMNFTTPSAHIGGGYGNDGWYDTYTNVLFYALGHHYPEEQGYRAILRKIADQFYRADSIMGDNYSHTFFDFGKMVPGKNHVPAQEDMAAGYAYILFSAYQLFGEERYLRAARHALQVLLQQRENRYYEVLMPFGAYLAARMNAEHGDSMDVLRLLNWSFDGDATNREGWGAVVGRWGEYDVHGIIGSTVHNGGYGFLMNTFDQAFPLVPMVRYDQRFARAIGRWMLNAANAARLFYPFDIPDSLQANPTLKEITRNVIAYEGLIKKAAYPGFDGRTPFAQGDGPLWTSGMPPQSMFSLYGSGHAGIFGSIIRKTNIEKILQLNCLPTDLFRNGKAYPTYLYYNPFSEEKTVKVETGNAPVQVYDAVRQRIVAKKAAGTAQIRIPANEAAVLVLIPHGAKLEANGHVLAANGVPVDFRYGLNP